MKRRGPDPLTLDLFDVPRAPAATEGALNYTTELCHLLSDALKRSPRSRYEVAARMSELLGHEVTKYQIDSWTAESRDGHRFPFEYAAAFEAAIESYCLSDLLALKRGCRVLRGEEALLAELGRIDQTKAELTQRERAIKNYLEKRR